MMREHARLARHGVRALRARRELNRHFVREGGLADVLHRHSSMSTTSTIRSILVPHDFSETAERALAFTLDLAAPLGARINVMFAYDVLAYGFPEAPSMAMDTNQVERAARTALEGVASRARRPGVAVECVVRRGPAWSEINAAAKETSADLIVIGTHGRRGVARALIGSVAEKVVRTAPCPVLTVHGAANER
jgi:nucleotide-binding universal stress UspA family protein